ncbi:MAG: CDP-alcohol phosphatidyltransferase family protein [Candidatus Helarchaeota archaeon]
MVFDTIPILKIAFELIFPIVLLIFLILLIGLSIINRRKDLKFMTFDDFLSEWLIDHGQSYRVEQAMEEMKKNPVGGLYQPLTYKLGKLLSRWGFTANKVSIMNLILSLFILYFTIMAGNGYNLDLYSQQPFYGALLLPTGLLVLFTGILDGVDGSIARLLKKKTKCGAWLDAVIDRICDTLVLVCLLPGGFLIPIPNLNFAWLVWTNVIIIFLYEYMRAKHYEVGLNVSQPFLGERPTRVLIQTTFFLIYGISSFTVLLTYFINPTATIETSIWQTSHPGIVTWSMTIFQGVLFIIMSYSIIRSAIWIWRKLKKMDIENGTINNKNDRN